MLTFLEPNEIASACFSFSQKRQLLAARYVHHSFIPCPEKVVIATESSSGLGRRLPYCSTSQCVIVVKQEIWADGPSLKSLTKTWRKVSENCSGQTVPWDKKSSWEEVDPRRENSFSTLFLKTGISCLFFWWWICEWISLVSAGLKIRT